MSGDGIFRSACEEFDYEYISALETIEQYTGLKDKNGKEIYEGDILCFPDTPKAGNWTMKWNEKECRYSDYYPKDKAEIIGNIHENPDLLK